MTALRVACMVFAALWPIAASAQLVVREQPPLPRVPNPADNVKVGSSALANCNTTLADIGARAVLNAIDQCPIEVFRSRRQYYAYARQAVIGLLVPGATEAAGLLALDKARENALFCISGALVEASGADAKDKAYLNALIKEAKELSDRAEFAGKLTQLGAELRKRGPGIFIEDGDTNTFVNTLDVQIRERQQGLGIKQNDQDRTTLDEDESGLAVDTELANAGAARYDTPENRARAATERGRQLARECRYDEADAALAQAQEANLEHLLALRIGVRRAEHEKHCLETGARKHGASVYLQNSLNEANAAIDAANRLDAAQTALIGELAQEHALVRSRRGDVALLKSRAAERIAVARQSGGNCDFDGAARALADVNIETLTCALPLDDVRRERDELAGQIEQLKKELVNVEREYASVAGLQPAEVKNCDEYLAFATLLDRFQGRCRTIGAVDDKIATLRQRSTVCAQVKSTSVAAGDLIAQIEVMPPKLEDAGARGFTKSTYGAKQHTWEREDRTYPYTVKIEWNYAGMPSAIVPGQIVKVTVEGGVKSEDPPGAGDGIVLSGVVAASGDVTTIGAVGADRSNKGKGEFLFQVSPNAKYVEIHLGGYPMGTGAIWRYKRAP